MLCMFIILSLFHTGFLVGNVYDGIGEDVEEHVDRLGHQSPLT